MNPKKIYQHYSDQQLLDQFRAHHNKECLGILLQRYTLLLLGVCMKYLKNEEEAKDAVQHVFAKAIVELEKYPVDHFKSWIYTVARNHCFMKLRNHQHPLPEEAIDENGAGLQDDQFSETLQKFMEKEKMLDLLEQSLGMLQPNQRDCVSLFYLEKLSYRQISEKTGFSLLQIKSFIQNGKRNIRLVIEQKMKENAS